MGRPRKPTATHKRDGTYRRDRANAAEPQPPIAAPDPPAILPPLARREWDRIVPELQAVGLLTQLDRGALAAYCVAFARWQVAEEHLAANGLTTTGAKGGEVQSPWLGISNRAARQMLEFLREFGLSPASRPKTSAHQTPDSAKINARPR